MLVATLPIAHTVFWFWCTFPPLCEWNSSYHYFIRASRSKNLDLFLEALVYYRSYRLVKLKARPFESNINTMDQLKQFDRFCDKQTLSKIHSDIFGPLCTGMHLSFDIVLSSSSSHYGLSSLTLHHFFFFLSSTTSSHNFPLVLVSVIRSIIWLSRLATRVTCLALMKL